MFQDRPMAPPLRHRRGGAAACGAGAPRGGAGDGGAAAVPADAGL